MKSVKSIQLAKNLSMPINVMTNKIALMGGNGSGKTYTTMKILEEVLAAKGWVIVLDPVGIYYGLRLDKSGQKPSGLNIPIFGGLHGDIPLTPTSGKLVADLICDKHLSAILDVSQFEDSELNRFATDFGNQFWLRMKAARSAVTLVLEECQEFIPQNPAKGEEKKLHIYNRITKIGRNYGIGVMMISARPQDINKKSLNLTQLMFAFQMTGTHERKAMEEWFTYSGYESRLSSLLPTLAVGQPYVTSPRLLKFNDSIRVLPKETFDASATPDFDDETESIALSPIDIASLQKAMSETIEQVKLNDPVELKKKIATLSRELQIANSKPADVPQVETQREIVEIQLIDEEFYKSLQSTFSRAAESVKEIASQQAQLQKDFMNYMDVVLESLRIPANRLEEIYTTTIQTRRAAYAAPRPQAPYQATVLSQIKPKIVIPKAGITQSVDIAPSAQRILDALAWIESVGLSNPKRVVIAFLANSSPRSSTFVNNLSKLCSMGLTVYPDSESLAFTESGRRAANQPERPLDSVSLQREILNKLPPSRRKILEVLISTGGDPLNREDIAARCGVSPRSSTFVKNLSALRTLGVIDYPNAQSAAALPILWI